MNIQILLNRMNFRNTFGSIFSNDNLHLHSFIVCCFLNKKVLILVGGIASFIECIFMNNTIEWNSQNSYYLPSYWIHKKYVEIHIFPIDFTAVI